MVLPVVTTATGVFVAASALGNVITLNTGDTLSVTVVGGAEAETEAGVEGMLFGGPPTGGVFLGCVHCTVDFEFFFMVVLGTCKKPPIRRNRWFVVPSSF